MDICVDCGRSVAPGSGRFVNRIPTVPTEECAFPNGDWVCADCSTICGNCGGSYYEHAPRRRRCAGACEKFIDRDEMREVTDEFAG